MQKKIDPIEKPGYGGKWSLWREKVDFFKTPVDKIYSTFWRGKIRLHLYTGLNPRVDYLEKSRPHRKTGYKGKSSFWLEKFHFFKTPGEKKYFTFWRKKKTFVLIHGSKFDGRIFGKKKSTPSKNRAMEGNGVFGGRNLTSSKYCGIKFI